MYSFNIIFVVYPPFSLKLRKKYKLQMDQYKDTYEKKNYYDKKYPFTYMYKILLLCC